MVVRLASGDREEPVRGLGPVPAGHLTGNFAHNDRFYPAIGSNA